MSNQIQCANCYCTLYFTGENGASGTTGELCGSCEREDERKRQEEEEEHKTYKLLGPDGHYESETPGLLGGNGKDKLYGRLDCSSAVRAVKAGDHYKKYRVFFENEETAVACGYRPCGNCMRAEYKEWKAEQADAAT